ncbi:MAG: F0F1 ATP synthase subunit A [Verrucomicrobiota bacterium]
MNGLGLNFEAFASLPVLAAGSISAESFLEGGSLTNSIFVAVVVMAVILLFTRMATRKMSLIPGPKQNLVEFMVEFLYNQVEEVVGKQVAPKAFPLLATIFVYVLISNWFGLLPGVGTIGFAHGPEDLAGPVSLDPNAHFTPLLRPASADLNTTLGMAAVFMLVWFWITMRETGPVEFIKHIFAPKGGLKGFLKYALVPIFLFVGVIEVISIVFRPVSLSLRLFGNVYAGETLLHSMSKLADEVHPALAFVLDVLLPLPFYFMEILVGVLQAVVFALLCAVYIQLSTAHDEEEH